MTVAELIKLLSRFPEDAKVGHIRDSYPADVTEAYMEDETTTRGVPTGYKLVILD